jgi:hypothetical protein
MADKKGGPLQMLGITPQFVSNVVTSGVSSGIQSATNQLFQGVGNQYLAQAASSVLTTAASSVVNVAISSALGQKATSLSGLSLSSGANILVSTVTPYVTGALAQGINQSLKNSLKGAGPFGEVLAQIGTSFVNQGLNGLTNLITGKGLGNSLGGIGGGAGLGTKYFPGAGDEPDANYSGGGAYTLGTNGPDVTFAIRPANSGAQAFSQAELADSNVSTQLSRLQATTPDSQPGSAGVAQKVSAVTAANLAEATKKAEAAEAGATKRISEGTDPGKGWKFICAPEEISWNTSNAVNRVDMFGTNNPPAISGTRGMRELTMRNSLVEGFSRNKTVEAKVAALENLLAYKSSTEGGFVNVPVYRVWANNKGYGQGGYFLLKSVQVKEMMRDLAGAATRASVDITFLEVPSFQVGSGIDQAPFSRQGVNSTLLKISLTALNKQATQATAAFRARATQGIGLPGGKPAAGAGGPSSRTRVSPEPPRQYGRGFNPNN